LPRFFPDWLKGYIDFTRASEAPLPFHFWTGVSTIAGALRGKVWRSEKQFRWTPNFYIVLVGPAGIVQKSTSINLGMELLEEVDDPGIKFGPPSATWQALIRIMGDAAQFVENIGPNGEDYSFTVSCVTLPISELGTFLKIAAEGLSEVLIEMWDGQIKKRTWRHATATTGVADVQNPWLNMIGATTPTWLRNNFPEAQIAGGLTSRIIFVYGEHKQRLIAYPSQEWRGSDYEDHRAKLISDLTEIARLSGQFSLTPGAIEWGTEWYADLHNTRPLHLAHERFDSYLARKQAFLHKLAMVRAAATGDALVITEETLKWADKLLTGVETHMIKAFQSIGLTDQYKQVEEIVALVRRHSRMTLNEIFSHVRTNMNQKDFLEALSAAKTAGLVEVLDEVYQGKSRKIVVSLADDNVATA